MNLAWAPLRSGPDAGVSAQLAAWGTMTHARIGRALDSASSVALLVELMGDYPRRGGKMMRPALCLAAAEAFGGEEGLALDLAAAIELFHAALLIHDDIEDESELRRGRPALHRLHGVAMALHAGDATLLMAVRELAAAFARLPPAAARVAMAQTDRMASETVDGQTLELAWRDRPDLVVSQADYITMVMKKTAWMSVVWPLQLGALAGGCSTADLEGLQRLGLLMGIAFQIQDDLLNFCADGGYGKEALGDLYEGKRTLMLSRVAARASPAEARFLAHYLAQQRAGRDRAMVEEVHRLMERHSAIEDARAIAQSLTGAALHEFATLRPKLRAGRGRDFLAAVIPWMCSRP